jgi:hypothetical protein
MHCLKWKSKFKEVTAKRFPSLKSISFEIDTESCGYETPVSPHFGVERIELENVEEVVETEVEDESDDDDDDSLGSTMTGPQHSDCQDFLHRALRCTSSQFPNVVELKLNSTSRLTAPLLTEIHACFPRLKVLDLLETKADFKALSGFQVNVDNWLKSGFSIETAPLHYQGSLQSFKDLEKVMLSEHTSVSESLVKHCLSKVPKLKSVTFKWEDGLSPETIRDHLGHVELIKVYQCSFFENKILEEKDRILAMLPGVFINHE